ncbi:MAG: DUF3387 domain-containing protein [Limnospira sp. PMC 1291.21]|uniref:Type I restriction enzyme endonuclease domain-containing protein n=1 Tax=Limnospira fusiformis PMC 851.14 TaxID=2219512 RepID=A0ABU9EMY2_LIMFS|nr:MULTISPECIES: type I restriction enzyme endonuclease domain-containing protein [Limnospira]MDC0838873.1 DUF3387 domain-containing protein [Limnoraphis robusta]MDY7051191.1 DUF3387 domain-containing protein [Limnospira fusiformis LS22]MDT9179979.1 DUF3387 domain-containing protein [Limnospira sp. PMC 1238.20]MDT9190185.1 DUF3387 domain-containing protein [Limnospira sp. PMC 894.15]MDT9195235.1 DUF3387 domain-containing protein [Limnospira sp. PMC 1245.20]
MFTNKTNRSTVEVLQELINLAQDIKAARQRGEEQGLSADEIAFYDALAENESAVEVMGNDSLKTIAHELLMSLKLTGRIGKVRALVSVARLILNFAPINLRYHKAK